MGRFCRDRETVLKFWKLAAFDKDCPWALRVYVVNELAKTVKIATEFPPIPGTYKPPTSLKPVTSPDVSKDAPTEEDVAAQAAVTDVKQFLKQLGGANGET